MTKETSPANKPEDQPAEPVAESAVPRFLPTHPKTKRIDHGKPSN